MLSKPTVKYIQSLQHKKFRDEHRVFVAEGPKLVNEFLLENLFECRSVYATEEWVAATGRETLHAISTLLQIIKPQELERISSLHAPNQVLAVFAQKEVEQSLNLQKGITLMLDDIQDPGNLGTIIRTADWFNISQIICSPHTADCYNSKVVQSTMASLGRVNIRYADLADLLRPIDDLPILAAVLEGKPLETQPKIANAIIVIGNESKGISPGVLNLCTQKISIARKGRAESLNAAVAAGIILHSLCR